MSQIKAQVIWKDGVFIAACAASQSLNCDLFTQSAVPAWLKINRMYLGENERYELTFTDPGTQNSISGIFVQEAGVGILVDAALTSGGATDVAAIIAACGVCCGNSAVVAGKYNGVYPAYVAPLAKTYTVVRTDAGDMFAQETFSLDYLLLISGTLRSTSYSGGQSTYTFQAYTDPVAIGTDVITETARVFTSNTAPSLSSQVFNTAGVVDGQPYSVKASTTLSSMVIALQADTIAGSFGTWAVAGSTITLTTSTKDYGTVVITAVAP